MAFRGLLSNHFCVVLLSCKDIYILTNILHQIAVNSSFYFYPLTLALTVKVKHLCHISYKHFNSLLKKSSNFITNLSVLTLIKHTLVTKHVKNIIKYVF